MAPGPNRRIATTRPNKRIATTCPRRRFVDFGPPLAALGLVLVGRRLLRQWLTQPIDLRGKVVLITGSSRGLGLALAEELARHGARLVLCARNEGPLTLAAERLTARGTEVLAVPCDVSDRTQVDRLIERATERFGGVDVLVNNAGIITVGPPEAQTLRDFEESVGVMFWGAVYPTLALLPQMRARHSGWIVNITSIGGKISVPHLLSYSCAKFAAVGFSEGLSAELAPDGIRVLTVVPGLMRTGSTFNAYFKGQHRLEHTWFSLLGNAPFTSASARDAAQQIVEALQRGETEVFITWQAGMAARLHALAPGLSTRLLELVSRMLPAADGQAEQLERRTGRESQTPLTRSFLTALGQRAARRLNQDAAHPGARGL